MTQDEAIEDMIISEYEEAFERSEYTHSEREGHLDRWEPRSVGAWARMFKDIGLPRPAAHNKSFREEN